MSRLGSKFLRVVLFAALLVLVVSMLMLGIGQRLDDGQHALWAYALLALAFLAGGGVMLARQRQREMASELRFHAVFDNAMIGIATVDPQGRWQMVNPALCDMLGYSEQELRAFDWMSLTHPDDLQASLEQFSASMRGERDSYSMRKRYLRKDGSSLHAQVITRAVRSSDGGIEYFVLIVENASERHAYEQRLAMLVRRAGLMIELSRLDERASEEEFLLETIDRIEQLASSSCGLIALRHDHDNDWQLILSSSARSLDPALKEAFCQGVLKLCKENPIYPEVHFLGASGEAFLPVASGLQRMILVPITEGESARMCIALGGKQVDYERFDAETLELVGNEVQRIVSRRRVEQALRAALEVVNASPVVWFRWRATDGWPVEYVSENVSQWGYTANALRNGQPTFIELVHPDDRARLAQEVQQYTAEGRTEYEQEYRLLTTDNRVIWVVDRTKVIRDAQDEVRYYDGVLTDITERKQRQLELTEALAQQRKLNKRLEEANNQLLQSEKMASIGQLAAGVAHELNNPIGFVHSNLGTLDGYLHDLMTLIDAYEKLAAAEPEHPQAIAIERLRQDLDFAYVREDIFNLVDESKDGLARVKKIVQDLKSFSRVGESEWKQADLHQGLDSTLNIVWNELKYKCEVVKDYGDIPPVYCLISQLNQVFMNLLVNAGHAIEKQGTVTIRTRRLGEDKVCVEISDTGCGIAPENLNRIFEPFFTTKPVGKGTGLGLSLAYGIVERHHGRIEVHSEVGVGTTFKVILPIEQAEQPTDSAQETA